MLSADSRILRLSAVVLLLSILTSLPAQARKRTDRDSRSEMFVVATITPGSGVTGQELLYEVRLYSETDAIAQVGVGVPPQFGGLTVYDTGGDTSLSRASYKGHEYFSAVIDRYYVDCHTAGKYSITGGTYTVYEPVAKVVNDPFWGPMRQTVYEEYSLEASDVNVKISALPRVPSGFSFSGAIGEFEVTTWLPEGTIKAGEEAVAIVSIAGEGNLSEADIPDLKNAFSGDVRLKSVSEERNRFIKDGRLWEELELECTFLPLPTDGSTECTIGKVTFGFYSTSKKRYIEVSSDPLTINLSERSNHSPARRQEAVGI